MAARDRATEIIEIKRRGQREATWLHDALEDLARRWQQGPKVGSGTEDFFPIRAVTLLEVFSRAWIRQLIDCGAPYAENAVSLIKDLKIDYPLVRAIVGRKVTLGDIVAHTVPLNSFGQVCSCFNVLIGSDVVVEISKATAWRDGPSTVLLIRDAESMRRRLVRLYEVRHVLCHEYPENNVYQDEEIPGFLNAAAEFAGAMDASLSRLAFGTLPILPADDMITAAAKALEDSEQLLAEVIARIDGDVDRRGARLLRKSQDAWLRFRKAASEMRGDNARGGSLSRYLILVEAADMTDLRIDQLRKYLDREEGSF